MIYQLISTSPHYRAHASPLLRIRLDALIFRALRASLVVMLGRASIRSHGFRCFPCNACILKSVAGTIVYSDSVRLVFSSKQTGSPFNSERSVFCHERTVITCRPLLDAHQIQKKRLDRKPMYAIKKTRVPCPLPIHHAYLFPFHRSSFTLPIKQPYLHRMNTSQTEYCFSFPSIHSHPLSMPPPSTK